MNKETPKKLMDPNLSNDMLPLLPTQRPRGRASGSPTTKPKKRWRKWIIIVGILAIVAVGVTQVIAILPPMGPTAPTQSVSPPTTGVSTTIVTSVSGLGVLRPRGAVRTVALPSQASEAVINDVLVDVGDQVTRGQPLATLDIAARLRADVAEAEANIRLREAELASTRATVLFELESARAAVEIARATQENARRAYERSETLFRDSTLSQAQRDQTELDRMRTDCPSSEFFGELRLFGSGGSGSVSV
ncbi:HlyD family secretion protein [Pseudaestuariivita rosea]|uniref:HlyD family secretion protein n=1 Tax=Pseudaestuariivita rosea TaxID=2763263 RepID=UPI001ABAEFE8|nr:hypothetical protein [Pseudaestuariivita rosea]